MIDKQTLIDRMGKQKAAEFMAQNRSDQPTAFDKTRGIRGRVKFRRCEHGVYVIDNYEPKPCAGCIGTPINTKSKDFKPYFNVGLGAYVESRSEERRYAKKMGLVEAG